MPALTEKQEELCAESRCAMEILYSLGHLGFTVPPQADQTTTSPTATPPS